MADNEEKGNHGIDMMTRAASTANYIKGAAKTGKQVAGAAKGASGPVGWALLAVENRKLLVKITIVLVAFFLLIPVVIIEMLPGVIFGGFGTSDETHNDEVEKAVFDDVEVVFENFDRAIEVVDSVMMSAHEKAVQKAYMDFMRYGPDDEMILIDHTSSDDYDSGKMVCDYSATTDFKEEINLDTMREKLEEGSEHYYFLIITEYPGEKERLVLLEDGSYTTVRYPYVTVTYAVTYIGNEYFEDDILGLTDEQKKLSEDYRDSLELIR